MLVVKKLKLKIGAPNRCLSHEPIISRQNQAQIRFQHETVRLLIYDSTELEQIFQNRFFQAIEWTLDNSILEARAMVEFS